MARRNEHIEYGDFPAPQSLAEAVCRQVAPTGAAHFTFAHLWFLVSAICIPLSCRPAPPPAGLPAIVRPSLDHFAPLARAPIEQAHAGLAEAPLDPRRNGLLGMIYHAHEMYTVASTFYRRAELLDPHDFRWPYLLGHAEARGPDPDMALAAFERARGIDAEYGPLLLDLADGYRVRGRWDEAATLHRQVLESGSNSARALCGLGQCEQQEGLLESAANRFRRAAELAPEARPPRYLLALTLRNAGRLEEAAAEFQRSQTLTLALPSDDPLLDEALKLGIGREATQAFTDANGLMDRGRFEEAKSVYERVLALNPDYVPARCQLGAAWVHLGEIDKAIRHLRRAVELDPRHAYSRSYLGWALIRRGDAASAVPHLRTAIELDPNLTDAYLSLGMAFSAMGRGDEAIEAFRGALAVDPVNAVANLELGKRLMEKGRKEEAAVCFNRVLEVDAGHREARELLARCRS